MPLDARVPPPNVLLVALAGAILAQPLSATMEANGRKLKVTTSNLTATFDGGVVISLSNRISGDIYTQPQGHAKQPDLNLLQPPSEAIDGREWSVTGGTAALELRAGERKVTVRVRVDEVTDEIVVRLAGESTTPGIRGLLWPLLRSDANTRVVVPARSGSVFDSQSLRQPVSLPYPSSWEAQMLVLEASRGSLLVYSPDRNATFKTLHLNPQGSGGIDVTLETQAIAPWRNARNVPELEWRLKAFNGDWRGAAAAYRRAMGQVPAAPRARNLSWTKDICAVVTLLSLDARVLDRLAELLVAPKTLIYVVDWRRDGYDINYPDYTPRDGVAALIRRAHTLGFRIMLHANLYGVSPRNPAYAAVRSFQVKDPETMRPEGWLWDQPESTPARFAFINPASSVFRDLLIRRLRPAIQALEPDAVHLDVSGVMFNDGNGLIEGMNAAQGALTLHRNLRAAFPSVDFGAEGMNELLVGHASFAQRWLTEYDPHPISTYLLSPHARLYGYLGQPVPEDPQFVTYLEKYEVQGVLPTLKAGSPADLDSKHAGTQRLISQIRLWQDLDFGPDWTGDWRTAAFRYRSPANISARLVNTGSVVRLEAGSQVMYERACHTNRIETGSYLPGWPVFDQKTLYGLDPNRQYWLEKIPRPTPPAHIVALPQGIKIGPETMVAEHYARFEFREVETTLYNFVARFIEARTGIVRRGVDSALGQGASANLTQMSSGGESRTAIFAHPPYDPPDGETFVEYTLKIPDIPDPMLEFDMGISDSARGSDGVTFAVAADGAELFRRHVTPGRWQRGRVSLHSYRGETVRLRFLTNVGIRGDSGWDWAGWSRLLLFQRTANVIDVPVALAAGGPLTFAGDGEFVANSAREINVKKVPVAGSFLLFLKPGTPVSAERDLLGLPPTVWRGVEGEVPVMGSVWSSGTVAPVASAGVKKNAINGHPPATGRTILAWALRLPPGEALRLKWLAGLADGSSSTGVEFEVRINGARLWRHKTDQPGWNSGEADLSLWKGRDVLVELVTDSLGDNSFDWAHWADVRLVRKD